MDKEHTDIKSKHEQLEEDNKDKAMAYNALVEEVESLREIQEKSELDNKQ